MTTWSACPPPEDLLGIVRYVLRCQQVRRDVLAADMLDGLEIITALRAQIDDTELALLRGGRRLGHSWAELATPAGLHSRQGAEQRMVRLTAAIGHRVRSERKERGHRARTRSATAWLAGSRERILDLAAAAASAEHGDPEAADVAGDLGEWRAEKEPSLQVLMALLSQMDTGHHLSDPPCGCAVAADLTSLVDAWHDVQGPPDS